MTEDIFLQRRAAQLAAEAERLRGSRKITGPMVLRAADIVSVKDAADIAGMQGRPYLAWLLRRLVARLRAMPIPEEEEEVK